MKKHRNASGLSIRTRHRAALIAAFSLPLSLMTAPAIAQDLTPPPTPSAPYKVTEAAPSTPAAAAMAQAKEGNKRVEIETLRSETGTYYANPDGKTLTAEVASAPVRVKRNGDWQSIDPTLIEENGVLRPRATKGDITLSLGGDTTAVAYSGEKGKGSVSVPDVLPKPVVKGNTATYPDVYGTGADLVISAHPEGFRHEIVLRQRPTKELKLRIPLGLPKGLKLGKGSDKTPRVLDSKGKEIADLSSTLVLDATEMREPATGRMSQAKTSLDGDGALVLKPDADFLADPAVTYPVTLAAPLEDWVGTGIAGDTFVSHSYPSSASNKGLNRIIVGRSNSGTVTWRGYIRFNIKGTPLEGGTVDNADLRLWNYDTNDCSDTATAGIVVRRITKPWDINTMTYGSGQPDVTPNGQSGEKGAYGVDCPEGEGEIWHTIESITQEWMNGADDYGVQLSSASESVPTNWRWYRSDEYGGYDTYPFTPRGPVLIIKYTPKPVEPLGAVAWTDPDEPGIETREDIERINADPDSVGATDTEPAVPSITDREAIEAREESPQDTIDVSVEDAAQDDPEADEPGPAPNPDSTAPMVLYTDPRTGAEGIYTDSAVQVTFSEGVTGAAVTLTSPSGEVVAGTTTMGEADSLLVFKPTQNLSENTVYSATVKDAADTSGNTMTTPYTWSFTTGGAAPAETTVTLPLQTDLFINDDLYGDDQGDSLWVGRYDDGDDTSWHEEAYLKFDAGQLAGKTVTEAKLQLWNSGTYGCGDEASAIAVRRVTGNWSATTIDWNTRPSSTDEGQALADDGEECEKYDSQWEWPATDIVRAWASGQPNHGLVLRGTDQSADAPLYDRGFHSSESSVDASRRPTLVVTYTGQGSPPPGDDTLPPSVVEVTPEDGAEGVPFDTAISVRFSEPVSHASLLLREVIFEEDVPGTATLSDDRTVLTFELSQPLDGFYYEATVSGVEDDAGNSMPDYMWSWYTQDWTSAAGKAKSASAAPVVKQPRVRAAVTSEATTPSLLVNVDGPQRLASSVTFEVAQPPAGSFGARNTIWSTTVDRVAAGQIASVRVPADKLMPNRVVHWRARAETAGAEGFWSDWQTLTTPAALRARESASGTSAAALWPPAENVPKKASQIFERLTPAKCAERKALSGRGIGWISNHFSWCQMGVITATYDYGMQFERYKADVILIGYTFNGKGDRKKQGETSRDLVVEAYLYNQEVRGTPVGARTMVLNMDIGNRPYCENVTSWNGNTVSNRQSRLISSWAVNGRATFRFKCDPLKAASKREIKWNEANSQGNTYEQIDNDDRVSYGTFRAWAEFPNWPGTTYRYVMANKDVQGFKGNTIRCDNASGTRYSTGGCIFYLTRAAVQWKFTAQAKDRVLYMKQAYLHYWNACSDADGETYPDNPDKIISGCDVPGSGRPLDKQYIQRVSATETESNHNKTTPICKSIFGTAYPGQGKECDEFPFASTRERTNGPNTGNWSFCPIAAQQNGDAGTALQEFYQKDRVILGDEFTNRFAETDIEALSRENLCGGP
ncbi:DNRLRE domain-containing protein [Nonomuraea sp. NPDC003709]|uniref:DNRLRE domain-containing protein n=1 Tax=Nonomuraea sp. NPDC003709 TaxID=3154450 RepID=UPI0033A2B25C